MAYLCLSQEITGVMVGALEVRLKVIGRGFDPRPFWASCLQTCVSVVKQYNLVCDQGVVMSCSWDGNRRSDVALAMHQTDFSGYPSMGSWPVERKTLILGYGTVYLCLYCASGDHRWKLRCRLGDFRSQPALSLQGHEETVRQFHMDNWCRRRIPVLL